MSALPAGRTKWDVFQQPLNSQNSALPKYCSNTDLFKHLKVFQLILTRLETCKKRLNSSVGRAVAWNPRIVRLSTSGGNCILLLENVLALWKQWKFCYLHPICEKLDLVWRTRTEWIPPVWAKITVLFEDGEFVHVEKVCQWIQQKIKQMEQEHLYHSLQEEQSILPGPYTVL